MDFHTKLSAAIKANDSLLCVGLDPQLKMLPDGENIEDRLVDWGEKIISQTMDLVCCYKPNFAFYEQFGLKGLSALRRTMAIIPNNLPVLLDVKRGDIGSTAAALADAAFNQWNADAVTLSPYLGEDSIKPFLAFEDKAVFVLCFTSNPSAAQIQQHGYPPLFKHIAALSKQWGSPRQVGLVVGATQPQALSDVRQICPQSWILAPGVGAQGGDLDEALQAGLGTDGSGMIIPVSRSVIDSTDPREAALALKQNINSARSKTVAAPDGSHSANAGLIKELYKAGCVKFGNFTLASGKQSPVYIDLRRVISFPELFCMVVQAYSVLLGTLKFDLIAGVPYAALPAGGAVAIQLGVPMIYPRKEVKQHGTGQAIEGSFENGQIAVLLEDVITTGGSIVASAEVLKQAGLIIKDVVVLVDRGQGGDAAMSENGLALHSVLKFGEILSELNRTALIDGYTYSAVQDYITANGPK